MDKKTIIVITVAILAVLIILGLVIGSYFYFKKPSNKGLENSGDDAAKITDSATQGVLPSIDTNPLGDTPDMNPVDVANPMKNIKTNPFE